LFKYKELKIIIRNIVLLIIFIVFHKQTQSLDFCQNSFVCEEMQARRVIVIRHGEKPKDKDKSGLSKTGEKRALMLVDFFQNHSSNFGEIVAIYAAKPTKVGSSTRPADTVRHLATSLNIPVNLNYQRESKSDINHVNKHGVRKPVESDQTRLAEEIRGTSHYHGKSVLICWEHHTIPDLVLSLGGPDIGEWGVDFGRTLVLEFDRSDPTRRVTVREVPQPEID
jgi:hypothetical protein